MKKVLEGEVTDVAYAKKNKSTYEIETSYARVSVKTAKDFGQGRLKIAASTFDFLVAVTPYVDVTGKICEDLRMLRLNLNMTISKFQYAFNQAITHKLLEKIGDQYYSRFHDFIGPNVTGMQYIPILNVMMNDKFLKLNLRDKRFFYYLLTAGEPGRTHRVALYNLYRNKLKKDEVGIGYFQTQAELLESIDRLMSAGLITVSAKIRKQSVDLKDENTKSELRMILGFSEAEGTSSSHRKRRISTLNDDDVLFFQIKKDLIDDSQKVINKASFNELTKKFEYRGVYFDMVKNDTKRFFVSAKNELYNSMHLNGVRIYHETLDQFIKDHYASVLSYEEKGRLFSIYRDHYLLPYITEMLSDIVVDKMNKYNSRYSQVDTPVFNSSIETSLLKYLKRHDTNISLVTKIRFASKIIRTDKNNEVFYNLYTVGTQVYNLYSQAIRFLKESAIRVTDVTPLELQTFIIQIISEGQIHNDLQLHSLVSALSEQEESASQNEFVDADIFKSLLLASNS